MMGGEGDAQERIRAAWLSAAPAAPCHFKDILAGLKDNVAAATSRSPLFPQDGEFQERKALKQFVAASSVLKHILAKSRNQLWSKAALCRLNSGHT